MNAKKTASSPRPWPPSGSMVCPVRMAQALSRRAVGSPAAAAVCPRSDVGKSKARTRRVCFTRGRETNRMALARKRTSGPEPGASRASQAVAWSLRQRSSPHRKTRCWPRSRGVVRTSRQEGIRLQRAVCDHSSCCAAILRGRPVRPMLRTSLGTSYIHLGVRRSLPRHCPQPPLCSIRFPPDPFGRR